MRVWGGPVPASAPIVSGLIMGWKGVLVIQDRPDSCGGTAAAPLPGVACHWLS